MPASMAFHLAFFLLFNRGFSFFEECGCLKLALGNSADAAEALVEISVHLLGDCRGFFVNRVKPFPHIKPASA